MKRFAATSFLLMATLSCALAQGEPRGLCGDGGSDTPSPTVAPTTTPTPTAPPKPTIPPRPTTGPERTRTPTTTSPPAPAPVDCKLYSEDKDPGAFDGVCAQDATDQSWYQHKNLSVEVEASNGGKACVPTTVTKLCEPVDCVYTDSGICELKDYAWFKTIIRTIQAQPLYGGTCPSEPAPRPVSCDVGYYCGGLAAPDDASCRAAMAKSSKVNGGFSFSGSWVSNAPSKSLWECVDLCSRTSECVAYSFVTSKTDMSTTCITWRTTGQIGFDSRAETATMR